MSNSPRVLLCSFDVVPSPTGTSRRLMDSLRGLQEHFTVDVLSVKTADHSHIERVHGARLLRVPVGSGDFSSRIQAFERAVRRQLESEEYGIVHFSDPFGGYVLCEARSEHGYRLVFDALSFPSHELRFTHPHLEGDRRFLARVRRQELFCLLNADAVITGSTLTRDFVLGLGVEEETIHILPTASDTESPIPPTRRASANAPLRVAYLGSQVGWQGLPSLFRAIAHAKKLIDVRLTLVGPKHPDWQPHLEALASQLDLSDCIEFHAAVPHGEVGKVLAAADVCVLPLEDVDRNRSPGGPLNKVADYLAAGKPIVATDLSLTRELLPASCTHFVPPKSAEAFGDALIDLADPEVRKTLGVAARAHAEAYRNPETFRAQLRSVYSQVSGKRAERSHDALAEPVERTSTPTNRIVPVVDSAKFARGARPPPPPDDEQFTELAAPLLIEPSAPHGDRGSGSPLSPPATKPAPAASAHPVPAARRVGASAQLSSTTSMPVRPALAPANLVSSSPTESLQPAKSSAPSALIPTETLRPAKSSAPSARIHTESLQPAKSSAPSALIPTESLQPTKSSAPSARIHTESLEPANSSAPSTQVPTESAEPTKSLGPNAPFLPPIREILAGMATPGAVAPSPTEAEDTLASLRAAVATAAEAPLAADADRYDPPEEITSPGTSPVAPLSRSDEPGEADAADGTDAITATAAAAIRHAAAVMIFPPSAKARKPLPPPMPIASLRAPDAGLVARQEPAPAPHRPPPLVRNPLSAEPAASPLTPLPILLEDDEIEEITNDSEPPLLDASELLNDELLDEDHELLESAEEVVPEDEEADVPSAPGESLAAQSLSSLPTVAAPIPPSVTARPARTASAAASLPIVAAGAHPPAPAAPPLTASATASLPIVAAGAHPPAPAAPPLTASATASLPIVAAGAHPSAPAVPPLTASSSAALPTRGAPTQPPVAAAPPLSAGNAAALPLTPPPPAESLAPAHEETEITRSLPACSLDPWLAQLVHGYCPPEGIAFNRPPPPTTFPGRDETPSAVIRSSVDPGSSGPNVS